MFSADKFIHFFDLFVFIFGLENVDSFI